MLKRAGIVVLVSLFLTACGGTSSPSPTNPTPTPPATTGPTPDDIGVTFGGANLEDGYLVYDVNLANNASARVDSINVSINLVNGDTVTDSSNAIITSGLDTGQQRTVEAPFFDTESLDEFECYEYSVQIIANNSVPRKDYPGTCD